MSIPSPRSEQKVGRRGHEERGRKGIWEEKSVMRGDSVNFLAHSRCSVNAHFLPRRGQADQEEVKGIRVEGTV